MVLAVGCMDAMVLVRWEGRREKGKQSEKWMDRQQRKIDGAMGAFEGYVERAGKEGREWLVGGEMSVADIAVVCAVGFVDFAGMREGWRGKYPGLGKWFDRVDAIKEFEETRPVMFDLTEVVV